MAQYLSPEWFTAMEHAAASHQEADETRSLRLREVINASPFGDLTYVMELADGKLSIVRDEAAEADVTFAQDYETAAALHRGELTTQEAFFAGKVRVSGHLNTLLENADLLQGVAPTFADVRAAPND